MSRIITAIAMSLILGFAVGAWVMGDAPTSAADSFESAAPMKERLLSLEQVIAEEREARLIMEDLLRAVMEDIERIDSTGPRIFAADLARAEDTRAETEREQRRNELRRPRDFASMVRGFQERRLTQLTDAGFSSDEARGILKREAEAQYKAMQAAHDAQRNGEVVDAFSAISEPQALLRAELGDSAYERYLQAQGQPTAIQITQVLDSSPGSRAGLQPGDEIVSYNGERVFNVIELRELTLQGRAGEDVIVEIERDGVRMQLNVPRGPVGITGSGASVRNMNRWGGG
jgi:membrane-associated protease RseP (regulator of RpoE activity)